MARKNNKSSQTNETVYTETNNFKITSEGMFEYLPVSSTKSKNADDGKKEEVQFDWEQIYECPIVLLYLLNNKKIGRVANVIQYGKSYILEIDNEIICNPTKFKTFMFGKQFFVDFSSNQISKWLKAVGRLPEVQSSNILGYNKEADAFFWTNRVLKDGTIKKPNEYGIVELDGDSYFMPYSDNVLQSASNKHIAKNISRFTYDDTATITFDTWFSLLYRAYSDKAILMAAFMIMSCFRDIVYNQESFTPTLFLQGLASSGKSASAKIITKCWGKKADEVSLSGGTNTDKSIPTLLSQVSNAPIMLNEWSENMSENQKRVIQGVWDGAGYHKATIDGSTESVDINSTLILTSNDIPQYEPFFSRQVFIEMNETTFTTDQIEAFNKLQNTENMCSVSREILSYRELMRQRYNAQRKENKDYIVDVFRKDKDKDKQKVPERYIDNIAVLITPICILIAENKISLNLETMPIREIEKIREVAINNVKNQLDIWERLGGLKDYFDNLRFAIDKNKAVKGVDYKFREDDNGDQLFCIKKPNFYNVYHQILGNKAKSKNDIVDLIRKSPFLKDTKHGVRFRDKDNKWLSSDCYCFDYKGINDRYGFDLSNDNEIF